MEEWSPSHPGHFTPMETAPSTNWIGGWVGPRAGMFVVAKQVPVPAENETLVIQPIA